VLTSIEEIVVNLIGSEQFAVFEINGGPPPKPVCGVGLRELPADERNSEVIARVLETGEAYIAPAPSTDGALTACVPLKVDSRVTGYVAIYRLLSHKQALEPLDHELFDLLASQAATALYCTALAERVREGGTQ